MTSVEFEIYLGAEARKYNLIFDEGAGRSRQNLPSAPLSKIFARGTKSNL